MHVRIIGILSVCAAVAGTLSCVPPDRATGSMPPEADSLEQLAGASYFDEVIGLSPTAGYRSRLLTAPVLYFREARCALDGGFRGTGKLWYKRRAGSPWQALASETVQPPEADRPVTNGEPLEDWWAVAAVPDGKAVFVFQCGDTGGEKTPPADTPHTTSEQDLVPTPESPRRWYPFERWPGSEGYTAYPNQADLDLSGAQPAACPARVHMFNLYLNGQVRGGLSFNQRKRGGPSFAHSMNGGNTTLGGFQNYQTRINSWLGYKYQVEIRFLGPLQHTFYGQMIADPQAFSFSDPVFHDDSPANDWPGKRWHLAPGERKSSFPVIELVTLTATDHIVRYIDAPGGGEVMGIGLSDRYMYVIVYAGACGVVTHVKYLQLYYPDQFRWTDGTPRAKEMTLTQFRNAVGNWSFSQ